MTFMDIFRSKLGSCKRPARVRVRNGDRAEEILRICAEHGWQSIVGIEPNKPEDISDIEKLLAPLQPLLAYPKKSRNKLCDCGSGKKYKRCCLLPEIVRT